MSETFAIGRAGATSPFREEALTDFESDAPLVEPEFSPPGEGQELGESTDEADEADMTEVEPETARAPVQGQSAIAVQAARQWDATDRPAGWIGKVYGLVVHTTGGGLPSQARAKRIYHTAYAVSYYTGPTSHGCHYVNGWRGAAGGDLLQIANEREQANGVGVGDQRRSIDQGRFEKDLPTSVVARWRARWPGVEHPLRLLPGTHTANSCYVHVECVPCVFHHDGQLIDGAPSMRPGLRFTQAQHEAVALLACDIARRNGWPLHETWWRTPRLLGHEDLTPYNRHDKVGGWDPGGMRAAPYFDWDFVYATIERECRTETATEREHDDDDPGDAREAEDDAHELEQTAPEPEAEDEVPLSSTIAEDETTQIGRLLRDVAARLAVVAALDRGERSENALTDAGFRARHPSRPAGPIRQDDPQFAELRDDWRDVRARIVRPALAERTTKDKLDRLVPRGRPGPRACCLVWMTVLEPGGLGSQGDPSEALGEVFTDSLGFVDLGHARETADVTLWALNQLQAVDGKVGRSIDLFAGKADLLADIPIDRRLALAQQLAYVDSVAHEIETFGVPGPGADNSSFSPEDLPSNLFGTVVAAAAFAADGGSNAAITAELKRMLTTAGAQAASVARAAQAVANQRGWWTASGGADILFPLGKRNFAAVPWLIDVKGRGARAKPSRLLVAPPLAGPDFAYESAFGHVKSADFQTRIDAIRASLPPAALTP